MKHKFLTVLLALAAMLCLCFGLAACDGGYKVNGTYYLVENGEYDKETYFTLNGGKWTDEDGASGDYEISGEKITFYADVFGERMELTDGTLKDGILTVRDPGGEQIFAQEGAWKDASSNGTESPSAKECTITYDANGGAFASGGTTSTQTAKEGAKLTAPTSPTRSNYAFAGWAKSKNGSTMWKFDEDIVSEDITLFAQWSQESAVILSVEGASIDGREIIMLVNHATGEVSLSNMVVCSDDSIWRLYSDPEGQREIPTKMVTNLRNGDNTYYIVVNSQNQAQVNVYELTVHRSYLVSVAYYNGESLLETAETYTGDIFTAEYKPEIAGYTFNGWKTKDGKNFTSDVLWTPLALYADKTVNTYKATLNVNGGDALTETGKTIAYDSEYSFPVPMRTGYSFTGWYLGNAQVTNANGKSLAAWNYTKAQEFTAHWEANQYTVTLKQNDKDAGTVSGGGDHAYDSQVTITATTKTGYNFLGWYDKDDKLVSENAKYTFKMGFAVSYAAKWDYYTVTATRNDTSAGTLSKYYTNEKVSVGTKVKLTATTNKGYTFIGWYKGEEEVSKDLSYQFTMTKENVSYEARWCKVTLSANNSSAGNVTPLNDTYKVGDEVTITATTNLGYAWLGWYKGEEEVSQDLAFQYTMTKENVSLEARWTTNSDMALFTFTSTQTTCRITGVKDKTKDEYLVPEYVTSITCGAFQGCSSVKSITLPFVGESRKTSKDVDQYPFGYLFGTSEFSGASSVEQFYYGNSTSFTTSTTYYIPDSLKNVAVTGGEILYGAFLSCSGLTSVTIGNGVTSIGDKAFLSCSGLTSVTIGNGVTSIGDKAFEYCRGLTSVTIGNGVTEIGLSAFMDCSGLTSVTIPESVTTIGSGAFWGCIGLKSITIPDGVTTIERAAFYRCTGLTSVTIPDGVIEIGREAFEYCDWLTSVTIPASVIEIGYDAFYRCYKLVEVWNYSKLNIQKGESDYGYVGYYALRIYNTNEASKQVKTSDGYLFFEDDAESYLFGYEGAETKLTLPAKSPAGKNYKICRYAFYSRRELTSIAISDGVTEIGGDAFCGCDGLTSVTIGNGVTSIGSQAFAYCDGLTVHITDLAAWCNIDFGDYSANPLSYAPHLYQDGVEAEVTKLEIPAGTTKIKPYAFCGCDGLTSVTIPDSVTEIGYGAFRGCSGLTSVTIPDSVTEIGDGAFDYCTGLTSVVIGKGVTDIGQAAFDIANYLTSVYYKGTPAEWETISIEYGNSSLNHATRYYYSAEAPTAEQLAESENWWHYAADGTTVEVWTKES